MYHRLTKEELLKLFTAASPEQRWVLDTETDGLDVLGHAAEHSAWWIGLSALGTTHVLIISIEEYESWGLSFWFERFHLVGHNLRFDLHALNLVPLVPWQDTMVAAYFGHTTGKRSMDHFARVYGWHNVETPEALKQGRIGEIPEAELFSYLENDCIVTSKMADRFQMGACSLDYRVEQAAYAMETRGIRLMLNDYQEVEALLNDLLDTNLATLQEAGLKGNQDSPQQVASWLVENGRKLPRTKTGLLSTSKLVLQKLADDGDELALAVITYRKAAKLKSAFILPLPKLAQDGILYSRINTTRTKTGRFSSDSPNLQQIPKRGPLGQALRNCLTSPTNDGIIACDFSQVELRVAASFANEPVLLEAFEQGRCPHTEVAAKIAGKAVADVTPTERFKAKAVNFGILNGMGSKRLAIELKATKGTASRFLEDYKRNLPKLHAWMEGVWREAESFRVTRTVEGRTRIFTANESTRPAVSVRVQGSAAELMRHALVAAEEAGLEPLLTVHDEILIGGATKERAGKLREVMVHAANSAYTETFNNVTFEAKAGLGDTWGNA
tara:strand:+ start:2076 stop:3743 length:1668 start_codon:yes stop_codon:yes gene_type:complete